MKIRVFDGKNEKTANYLFNLKKNPLIISGIREIVNWHFNVI